MHSRQILSARCLRAALPSNNLILIGEIVRTQGIKGKLKARIFADLDICETLKGVYLGKENETATFHKIASAQIHKGTVLIALEGVGTMSAAEELIGSRIFANKDELEKLPEGEYYWFQVIGLSVFADNGEYLGKVEEIFQTGSNDVYVVREGQKEYLIPAIEDVVKEIDIPGGKIVISPMKGLLGEE